ncbi:MAG: hypothetical protein ACFFFH_08665 [Candidatus Thorarchaeota archaeon]
MKVCNSCGNPLTITKNIITEIWYWILNQDYSNDVKIEKNSQNIILTGTDSVFVLKMTLKPNVKIIEEWNTPIGFHEEKFTNNRAILDCLNKWYKALKQTEDNTIFDIMNQNGVITVERTNVLCSICKQGVKDHKNKPKKRVKKLKKISNDLWEEEAFVAADVKEAIHKRLEAETLKELIATAIKGRINAGEKKKITWKDLIKLYLEENVLNTKKRHPKNIAEALGLNISQVNETLEKLEEEKIILKEFEFFDFYILVSDYNSETARKQLEILDYLKQNVDCPSTKCTQFSISLSFDLPFAIVGFILNSMTQNRLISKESIEVPTNGVIKKVACYIPSSY